VSRYFRLSTSQIFLWLLIISRVQQWKRLDIKELIRSNCRCLHIPTDERNFKHSMRIAFYISHRDDGLFCLKADTDNKWWTYGLYRQSCSAVEFGHYHLPDIGHAYTARGHARAFMSTYRRCVEFHFASPFLQHVSFKLFSSISVFFSSVQTPRYVHRYLGLQYTCTFTVC